MLIKHLLAKERIKKCAPPGEMWF